MRNSMASSKLSKRRLVILAMIVLAAVAGIVLADVVYVYQGQVNVSQVVPLKFLTGPNGNNSYVTFTGNDLPLTPSGSPYYAGFQVNIELTNSSGAYFVNIGELQVQDAGYLYVPSLLSGNAVSSSGSSAIQSLYIYLNNTDITSSSAIVCTIVLTYSSTTGTWTAYYTSGYVAPGSTPTSNSPCSLSASTNYGISMYVIPNAPITSSTSETVTVTLGYNVISNTAVPVP